MKKNEVKELQEQLLSKMGKPNKKVKSMDDSAMSSFCGDYLSFLDRSKTEREAVVSAVELLKNYGFEPFDPEKKYAPGEKAFWINRNKSLLHSSWGMSLWIKERLSLLLILIVPVWI